MTNDHCAYVSFTWVSGFVYIVGLRLTLVVAPTGSTFLPFHENYEKQIANLM